MECCDAGDSSWRDRGRHSCGAFLTGILVHCDVLPYYFVFLFMHVIVVQLVAQSLVGVVVLASTLVAFTNECG